MNKFKTNLVTAAACIASTFLFFPVASVSAAALTSTNNPSNFITYKVPALTNDPLDPRMFSQSVLKHWVSNPIKEDVPKDKIWNINLKNPISKDNFNDSSIFVLDDKNNKVAANLALSDDGKQIKVSPMVNYNPAHGYLLCIIGSDNGTCMPFTINSDSVKVDQSFNSKSITLKKGETLQLTLPNVGYDGGYSWKLNSFDNSVIKNTDNFNIRTSLYPGRCPGGGLDNRWLFKAVNTGTTSLNLEYQRSWEGSSSDINTFKLNINVQ